MKRLTRPAGTVWDAEDVVQSAYERALRYYNPDTVDNFEDWFGWVVRNALIDKLNEERGQPTEELDEFDHEAVSYELKDNLTEFVKDRISREKEEIQPILELFFIHGYPAREIYECNKFSYPNTRKIIQRFRDKLLEKL